jgi:23S rRNA pseudouridine2605 synthase
VDDQSNQRLNKLLALKLGISRREADEHIAAGRVAINGTTALLGARVDGTQTISLNGQPIEATPEYRYILLHKPVGYVCSRKAQGDNPTIYDLLPEDMKPLKPVGRLDKDSSGMLLLTNDGNFAHHMTHPRYAKAKEYTVQLDAALAPLHQQMISDYGVDIGDGASKLALERADDSRKIWNIVMREGRNRQIRRTFAALGYDVTALHRVSFGPYSEQGLVAGEYKEVPGTTAERT